MLLLWGLPLGSAYAQQNGIPQQPVQPPVACVTAELTNGFSIRYQKYEVGKATTRLWMCDSEGSGYVDVLNEEITHLEEPPPSQPLEQPRPSPVPSRPAAPALANSLPPATREAIIRQLIAQAAARYQLDADFVASVVKAESAFNPGAVSPKGAQGLMQLMPETATAMGVQNAFDPAANVDGGTKYLRQLLEQYNGDAAKALAAYNAGPSRVKQYGGVPPYQETVAYILRVINDYNHSKTLAKTKPQQPTTPSAK